MSFEPLAISMDDAEALLREASSFIVPSTGFAVLDDHYGFRPGCKHVLIGTTGAGKSTFVRSILTRLAVRTRVLLYSCEEDLKATKTKLARLGLKSGDIRDLRFVHEKDFKRTVDLKDSREWVRALLVQAKNADAQVVFIDNLTTSDFYDPLKPNEQTHFISELNEGLSRMGISAFIVAHAKRGTRDDQALFAADDVRGCATLANSAEYLYTFQRFESRGGGETSAMNAFVSVKKCRYHDSGGNVYMLAYSPQLAAYVGDRKIRFDDFNKLYMNRVRLGKDA